MGLSGCMASAIAMPLLVAAKARSYSRNTSSIKFGEVPPTRVGGRVSLGMFVSICMSLYYILGLFLIVAGSEI